MTSRPDDPLLTLEPLIEAVREGVESMGWTLSGLQKTTSHQFEGRWAGDSSRSAYLFFHRPEGPEWASVDVFLDETTQGLMGNLALVVDARRLGEVGGAAACLAALAKMAAGSFPAGLGTPITLRFRLDDAGAAPEDAETEARFKVRIPRATLRAGAGAARDQSAAAVAAFGRLMDDPALRPFLEE
ncbi:MAG: hypothetical protein AMXMBFR53_11440 [Gemmatimonadota bacterium]